MEAVQSIIAQPSWAHDFCYYFLAAAVVTAVYGIYAIFQMLSLPGLVKRLLPTTTITIALVLSIALSVVLSMMQFWICRSALAPAPAKAEKFAVKCASDVDCQAVGGMPQGATCACGGRGLCGGCVMQNNMEPQASFAAEFAPIEGFRVNNMRH
jgi:hypothetical protein